MPLNAGHRPSSCEEIVTMRSAQIDESICKSTLQKRKLRASAVAAQEGLICTPMKWTSARRCVNSSPGSNSVAIAVEENPSEEPSKSTARKLSDGCTGKPNWNPRDIDQISAVKEALHVSTAPSTVVCREKEQKKIFDFCKACIEQEKAGSMYVCGCPGTGKSLSMEKVKQQLVDWAKEAGFQPPDVLTLNCTSLAKTSEIFGKIIESNQQRKKPNGSDAPLLHLHNMYSQQQSSFGSKMMLIIVDELDYLITRDRAVLHDLFILTTLPFSRCILIGIANAIDLADRFLPRLQSLNCKPLVVTFRAYSKDEILRILHERLMAHPCLIFDLQALELCARKVAAATGDMRKALCVCRTSIEILEAELRESGSKQNLLSVQEGLPALKTTTARGLFVTQENDMVRIDHMAAALSKAYRSPIVDNIKSLPQHQQIILCSAVKCFRAGKKDATLVELNKSYVEICKSTTIPPVGILEFSTMCRVLSDQGLLKLSQSRNEKLRRIRLNVDEADITFALQGVRFFRNCLQLF